MRFIYNVAFIVSVKLIFCAGRDPKEGDVRLVDGSNNTSPSEGRVDIYLNGKWGTICDDAWDIFDANIVCTQLGFVSVKTVTPMNTYPSAGEDLPIHVKDVFCIGHENKLHECELKRNVNKCYHHEDATLACKTIHLRGGENEAVGQVEILLPNPSQFCQDSFDQSTTETVCTKLGYSSVEDFGYYGSNEREIIRSTKYATVGCIESTGSELCDVYNMECPSLRYASVNCSVAPVRIVPVGENPLEGRLEVLVDGSWGSICSELWNNKSAAVACRQLGNFVLKPVNSLRCCGEVGKNKRVAFDNLICIGDEQHLERCPLKYKGGGPSCHVNNVGMVCTDTRLVGGRPGFPEGRVEVVTSGQWGNVCADSWTMQNADVVCQQLYDSPAYATWDFGQGTGPVLMSKVDCSGAEYSITECSHLTQTDTNRSICNTNRHAGVVCQGIRLNSTTRSPNEGRVEVLVDGIWGSICGDSWTVTEASVVCRQLGHCSALRSAVGEHGIGVQRMHWTRVSCFGNENTLGDCNYTTGISPCYNFHFEAGAVCIDSCPDLHTINHLIVSSERKIFRPGDTITVRCEEDFVLMGSPEMTCMHGCQWSHDMPFCSSSLMQNDDTNSSSNKLIIILGLCAVGLVLLFSIAVCITVLKHNRNINGDASTNCLGFQPFRHHKTSDTKPSNTYDICGRGGGTYESIGPRPIIYYQGMLGSEAKTDGPITTDAGYEIPNATYSGDERATTSFCTFVF